jgi:hypothetical protein
MRQTHASAPIYNLRTKRRVDPDDHPAVGSHKVCAGLTARHDIPQHSRRISYTKDETKGLLAGSRTSPSASSFCYTCCPRASTASATTGSLPTPTGPRTSRRPALLDVAPPAVDPQKQPDLAPDFPRVLRCPCPRCGARMIIIEVFARGCQPSWWPTPARIDTS